MYIELFLLDNLLMNLLIVRLAAALLSVRPPLYLQTAVSLLAAVYAALAAYLLPVFGSIWLRPALLAVMALSLPFRGAKGYFFCCAAMLFATFAAGGTVVCAALAFGGSAENGFVRAGVPLRAALLGAAAVSLLPRAARALLKRRLRGGMLAVLSVEHGGLKRSFTALIDTGNRLSEPVTGLPVAVVNCGALKRYAKLPLRIRTAAGEHIVFAFRPERACVEGVPVDCIVAITDAKLCAEALIPPELCRKDTKTVGTEAENENIGVPADAGNAE